jgi:hypothetical protein
MGPLEMEKQVQMEPMRPNHRPTNYPSTQTPTIEKADYALIYQIDMTASLPSMEENAKSSILENMETSLIRSQ